MRRTVSILATLLFLAIAPGTVAGLVPWWISRWRLRGPLLGIPALATVGVLFVVAGALVLLESFARFAWKGLGTPAPVFPTRHLVISGTYRYVRNPMYVAVVSTILGQALLFGSVELLAYAILVWLCFHLFVLGYEEPALRRSFGAEYKTFCIHVPRWLPRLRPWAGRQDWPQ
jgi:protein-S-isoprenylcysteine O-methyltransferase Ste14